MCNHSSQDANINKASFLKNLWELDIIRNSNVLFPHPSIYSGIQNWIPLEILYPSPRGYKLLEGIIIYRVSIPPTCLYDQKPPCNTMLQRCLGLPLNSIIFRKPFLQIRRFSYSRGLGFVYTKGSYVSH